MKKKTSPSPLSDQLMKLHTHLCKQAENMSTALKKLEDDIGSLEFAIFKLQDLEAQSTLLKDSKPIPLVGKTTLAKKKKARK